MFRDADRCVRALVLVVAIALGLWLRVRGLEQLALFGDEYHTLEACEAPVGTILTTFDDKGSHTVLPLLQHLCLGLFGDGTTSFRLPALIPGILLLLCAYPLLRPSFGAVPACLATALLAVHPMLVYYARFARSYALLLLLAVVLLALLARLLARPDAERAGGGPARSAWLGVALLAFLLPYTHLSSAGFVAAAAVAAMVLAPRAGHDVRLVSLAFGSGAALCGIAFLPILGQVRDYFVEAVPEEFKQRPTTWIGVPLLLAGSVAGVWVWGLGFVAGLVVLARERLELALLAAAAVLGPGVTLLVTTPHGMEFAWARYLLIAVPVVPLVLAWLLRRGLGRVLAGERAADRATLALGLAGVVATALAGPFSPLGGEQGPGASFGPYDNSYLAMRPLPAYDGEWPDTPAIYRELAADAGVGTVVELPPMLSRSVLLYRNHARVLGRATKVGWPVPLPAGLRGSEPYVTLEDAMAGAADVIVLHRTIRQEVSAYWKWVNEERWPALLAAAGSDAERDPERGFVLRYADSFVRGQGATKPEFVAGLETVLRERLGAPDEEDERVAVWRVPRP